MAVYSPESLGIKAPSGGFLTGGWYSSRQYWNGTLSEPGVIHPSSSQQGAGQAVSNEVIAQTAPENVSYIEQQRQISTSQVSANQIQAPVNIPLPTQTQTSLTAELETARKALEQNLAAQETKTQEGLTAARAKEQATLEEAKPLTEPFREKLEKTERERLGTEEVLASQKELLSELDQLLTEGNELIRQQQEVTGLASIRNPRIQQTMEDVAARAGVINAVVALQNTYLANAYQSIDRTINAITQDRQDRLSYYNTILSLANRDIVELTSESRKIAEEQTNLLKFDLENAQETVDTIKNLMLDPSTALLMAQAGVSLNDSVETINIKMAEAQFANEVRDMANEFTSEGGVAVTDPSTVPATQLKSFTDSRGQVHYYKIPKSGGTTGSTGDDYLKTLNTTTTPKTTQSLNFTPLGGVGSVYVDPTTGQMWQYTSSGWKKI